MTIQSQTDKFILDMVHNNPGEKPYETPYNDPYFLKSEGFNGSVSHWHVNCAIFYNAYNEALTHEGTDEYYWIENHAKKIKEKLKCFEEANIATYPFTDFLVFPKSVWDVYGDEISSENSSGRHRKPDIRKKRTQELLRFQIEQIFKTFPGIDGITLRFGETYLHDTPYHMGNSPIRNDEHKIEDHILLIKILREEVCVKRNKKLFYRTWDFNYNFHNNPDFYLSVTNKIKPHRNLIFSMKYQQDDFHRNTPFNPCLGIGKHQQIIESQSRMEAYGKGAHPYYIATGFINGWPETYFEIEFGTHKITNKINDKNNPRGIKDIISTNLIKGVVTWSNGGGWGGPYIKNEFWSRLNTYVVSNWMKDTSRSEEDLFYEFAHKNGINGYSAYCLRQLALLTVEAVRKGHGTSYAANNMWWTRDEYFSYADNKSTIEEILKGNLKDKVLAEKSEASAMWLQIESLSRQISCDDKKLEEFIRVSSAYGRIKYQLIEIMWKMMIEYYEIQNKKEVNREYIAELIFKYNKLWNEWKALKENNECCPTLYTDLAFRNNYKGSIRELTDKLINKLRSN